MGTAGVGIDPSVRINDGSTHGLILDVESGRLIGKTSLSPSRPLPFPLSLSSFSLSYSQTLFFSLIPFSHMHKHTAHAARHTPSYSLHYNPLPLRPTLTPSFPLPFPLSLTPSFPFPLHFLFLFLLLFHSHPVNTL